MQQVTTSLPHTRIVLEYIFVKDKRKKIIINNNTNRANDAYGKKNYSIVREYCVT